MSQIKTCSVECNPVYGLRVLKQPCHHFYKCDCDTATLYQSIWLFKLLGATTGCFCQRNNRSTNFIWDANLYAVFWRI